MAYVDLLSGAPLFLVAGYAAVSPLTAI
jgi:hypothetical protein